MHESAAIPIQSSLYSTLAFITYLLLVSAIGVYASRFASSGVSEYFVGGRKMNRFVVALSAVVSGRSSWLLLGVTGMAYKMGLAAMWAVIGYSSAEFFLFYFYARRLRRASAHFDCVTLPDFFAARFEDKNGLLRGLMAIIILLFMVGYVAAQFVGGGKAFAASFNLQPQTGIWITAAIVLFYTVTGGFLAVSLTDMLQAFFMLFALLVLPIIAIWQFGGVAAAISNLQGTHLLNPLAITGGTLIGFLGIGLGSAGNPHIITRYMSIKDSEQLKYSAWVGTFWNVLMAAGALCIGLAGRLYFPQLSQLPSGDTEQLYPLLAQTHLHPVLFGIVVASIFAAIMSTADSQLLVAASAVVRDIYQKILKRDQKIAQRQLVFYSRITVVSLVLSALILGMLAQNLVFWLVLFAWAGLGAALGPTSILALYWRGATRMGVFCGMIAGAATAIIWYYIPILKSNLYELVPAFIFGFIVTVIVSKFSSPPQNREQTFDVMTTRQHR